MRRLRAVRATVSPDGPTTRIPLVRADKSVSHMENTWSNTAVAGSGYQLVIKIVFQTQNRLNFREETPLPTDRENCLDLKNKCDTTYR